MADKLFEDSEFYWKRFSCECLHPTHIVDVYVEAWDDDEHFMIIFEGNLEPSKGWKNRLKAAWNCLRGRVWCESEFHLRPEDVSEMMEVLRRALPKEERFPMEL